MKFRIFIIALTEKEIVIMLIVKNIETDESCIVYGTRLGTDGCTYFFLYGDGYWFWEDAEYYRPVSV